MIKLRDLQRILRRFGVQVDPARGKGSHLYFYRDFPEGRFGYPIPNQPDVKAFYVKGCRQRFRLTPQDGVSDQDFYGG